MNIHTKTKTLIIILILNIACTQVYNTTTQEEYSTIGEALQIGNVNSGDIIQVDEGVYTETFTIDLPITLEGNVGAIIDASNHSNAISIMGNNIFSFRSRFTC